MDTTKIQKINWAYLLGYIFLPILICAACYGLCYACFRDGGDGAVWTTVVPTLLAILWWSFGGSLLFKRHSKAFEKQFEAEGYRAENIFYGRGKTVIVDSNKGQVGLIFFWNPWGNYIFPASRVEKAWVDDGKHGSGFLEGSQRVGFILIVDGIKVRIDTFVSNQRFKMDDQRITRGIAKANIVVQAVEKAKRSTKK